jgi:hypothetical protein
LLKRSVPITFQAKTKLVNRSKNQNPVLLAPHAANLG